MSDTERIAELEAKLQEAIDKAYAADEQISALNVWLVPLIEAIPEHEKKFVRDFAPEKPEEFAQHWWENFGMYIHAGLRHIKCYAWEDTFENAWLAYVCPPDEALSEEGLAIKRRLRKLVADSETQEGSGK